MRMNYPAIPVYDLLVDYIKHISSLFYNCVSILLPEAEMRVS